VVNDTFSFHIGEVRRVQSRLAIYPKKKENQATVFSCLGENTYDALMKRLDVSFGLCRFHPFPGHLDADLSDFDRLQSPEPVPELPSQTNPLSAGSADNQNSGRVCLQNYSLYSHIGRLVIELTELPEDKQISPAPRQSGHQSQSAVIEVGSRGSRQSGPAGRQKISALISGGSEIKRNPPADKPVSGNFPRALGKPGQEAQDNDGRTGFVQFSQPAEQYVTIVQRLIESLEFFETQTPQQREANRQASARDQVKSTEQFYSTPSDRAAVRRFSPPMADTLTNLTEMLLDSNKERVIDHSRAGSIQPGSSTPPSATRVSNEKKLGNRKASVSHHEADREFGDLVDTPATPLKNPPPAKQRAVISDLAGFSLRNISPLETLKVADALSDYLREQAYLDGVDLL